MGGMHRNETLAEDATVREQLHRPTTPLRDALLYFSLLLGHVHVKWHTAARGIVAEGCEPLWRDGTQRMGRDADDHLRVGLPLGAQSIDVPQHVVDLPVGKSPLRRMGFSFGASRVVIRDAQE